MPLATYQQTSFLGGEWSPFYQGRAEIPHYRIAMNACRNSLPIEEGTWVRRPGTRLKAPTYNNMNGRLYAVEFSADEPYQLEFTNGFVRFYQGHELIYTTDGEQTVTDISTANPSVITLASAVTWATDDEIVLTFDNAHPSGALPLRQRILHVTKLTTTTFSLQDSISAANIDGSTLSVPAGATIKAKRVLRLTTPYINDSWADIRIIRNQDIALILQRTVAPQVLTITPGTTAGTADASLFPAIRHDGPYLDNVPDSELTASAETGEVTVTVAFSAWSATKTYGIADYVSKSGVSYKSLLENNLNQDPVSAPTYWETVDNGVAVTGAFLDPSATYVGFQATDVGRHIRIYMTPPEWDKTTAYAKDDFVTRDDQAYRAGVANTNVDPLLGVADFSSDTGLTWVPVVGYQKWTWGTISAYLSSTSVKVQIRGEDIPLYNGATTPTASTLWRLGVYSETTYYPSCGTFYEGRFWFAGSIKNRFDTTESQGFDKNGVLGFAPTLTDGTVTDASGLSYILEGRDANEMFWIEPDHNDLICGTLGGEWMIQASSNGEPITPTSIRAKRVTKYGCANIEPRRTGLSLVFVQKYRRRVMEFVTDVFSGRYSAPHLNEAAKHLTVGGVNELAYQEELAPIIWCRAG